MPKKIKKISLYLLITLFLINISYAITMECNDNIVLQEDFNYNDGFSNHNNWIYSSGGSSQDNETPIISPFTNNAFGINHTVIGGGYTANIHLADNTFNLTGRFLLRFNFSHKLGAKSYATISYHRTGTSDASIFIYFGYGGDIGNISIGIGSSPSCYLNADRTNGTIQVEFDTISDEVSLYIDNEISTCTGLNVPFLEQLSSVNFYREQGAGENARKYIDDITVCSAVDVETSCPHPMIFCDDFNYETPMITREWSIENLGGSVNSTFTPIDYEFNLRQKNKYIVAKHKSTLTDSYYIISNNQIYLNDYRFPAYSVEFDLNMANVTNNKLEYTVYQKNSELFILRVDKEVLGNSSGDLSFSYLNSSPLEYVNLCGNKSFSEQNNKIKINYFFSQRNEFPFNSTIDVDDISLYINDELCGSSPSFFDKDLYYISNYKFDKFPSSNLTIDNYYVMVGTDKYIDTTNEYFFNFVDNVTTTIATPEGDEDLVNRLSNFWISIGLKSKASRAIFGLFLLSVILISTAYGVAELGGGGLAVAVVLGIATLILIFLFVYIGLLPSWIIILLTMIGIGILLIGIKNMFFNE